MKPTLSHRLNRSLLQFLLSAAAAITLGSCASYDSGAYVPSPSSPRRLGAASSDTARAEPAPDRPGLGTDLGHELHDRSRAESFYRRGNTPDSVASFHYNDEAGAKAMAELAGKASRHGGKFDLADGKLRASLMRSWGGDRFQWYRGGNRIIVIGEAGAPYRVELENPTRQRIEVVVSVDGLDVRSGAPASFTKRGYTIKPKSSVTVDGLATGGKLRQFKFGSVRESQASKAGGQKGARNVGVIGIAVFVEDEAAAKLARANEGMTRSDAQAFPGS